MRKKFNHNKKHIGLINYGGTYFPSNEKSTENLVELGKKIGIEFSDHRVTMQSKNILRKVAGALGFEVHFFHKGLGR